MDLLAIRQRSLDEARKLGYPVNESLPLLDETHQLHDSKQVVDRALVLYVVSACSYGFSPSRALDWLRTENLFSCLTPSETKFISEGEPKPMFQTRVEGLYALAWALNFYECIDFGRACPEDLVKHFPDIKTGESSEKFRNVAELRSTSEIVSRCDLAYCLHWSIRDAELNARLIPGKIRPQVIVERRRALEWIISTEEWDDITLDT